MSKAITFDDVEARVYETSAATSRATSAVKKQLTIFSFASDLWSLYRRLKSLNEFLDGIDFREWPGMSCQQLEKLLTELIQRLDNFVELARKKGLANRTLTAGSIRAIVAQTDRLKDSWVALSSSTDSELDEQLATADGEPTESWESLWR